MSGPIGMCPCLSGCRDPRSPNSLTSDPRGQQRETKEKQPCVSNSNIQLSHTLMAGKLTSPAWAACAAFLQALILRLDNKRKDPDTQTSETEIACQFAATVVSLRSDNPRVQQEGGALLPNSKELCRAARCLPHLCGFSLHTTRRPIGQPLPRSSTPPSSATHLHNSSFEAGMTPALGYNRKKER